MKQRASRLRQKLVQTNQRYQAVLEDILAERGPLIRGTFGTRRRVCGAANCRCARGELHESKFLTAPEEGQTRQVHVPAAEEAKVASGVERYRRVRKARSDIAELGQLQLAFVDDLTLSLLQPYPKDRPLPPPRRRGRKLKGE